MIMISSHLTKIKTCPVRVYMYIYAHKAYTPVDLCRTSRLLPVSFPSPILTLTYCTPSHCQRKGLLIIDIIRHSLETGRIRLLYNYSLVLDGGIKKKPSESTYYRTVSVCLIVLDVSIKLDHFRKSNEIPTRNIGGFNPQESTAWYAQIGSSPQVRVKIRKIFETIVDYSSIFVVCVGDLSLIYFHMLLMNFLVSSKFQLSLWFGAIYLGSIHRHIGSLGVSQRVPPRPQVTLHLKLLQYFSLK